MKTTPLLVLAAVGLGGCFPARTPMGTLDDLGTDHDTVVLLLPGFAAHDHTFEKKGVIDALRAGGLQADLVAADATFGYYMRRTLLERLDEDVLVDLRGRYDQLWVLGISMGGMGALLTAEAYTDDVDGVVLMSPYLGRKKTWRGVADAGGLASWTPPAEPEWDQEIWTWLKQDERPPVYLGHGDKDLGVEAHELLAASLPADHVEVVPGGHTWEVWRELGTRFADDIGAVVDEGADAP